MFVTNQHSLIDQHRSILDILKQDNRIKLEIFKIKIMIITTSIDSFYLILFYYT